jgi:hypothetical protein
MSGSRLADAHTQRICPVYVPCTADIDLYVLHMRYADTDL